MTAQTPNPSAPDDSASSDTPTTDPRRNRLGRGLAALIGDAAGDDTGFAPAKPTATVPVEAIRANPKNPRKTFREDLLVELAESVRDKGLLQPLIVRPVAGMTNQYEIVAGERRWRAAQLAQLHDVPVVVKSLSDAEALEIAIVENVQRSDLDPIEEADGYQRLMDEFRYTQDELSQVIGKSRSHVANTLRLTKLPEKIKGSVSEGLLSAGHARAILSADEPDVLAAEVIRKGLSVRQTEAMAKRRTVPAGQNRPKPERDADTRALESKLTDVLGLAVTISHNGKSGESGSLNVRYTSLDQLDDLCRRLMTAPGA